MEKRLIHSFYTELGHLLEKFGVHGLCGLAFSDDKQHFIPLLADPADTETMDRCKEIAEVLRPLLAKFSGSSGTSTFTDGLTGEDWNN